MPYLSALEVLSRQGAIQIQVIITFTFTFNMKNTLTTRALGVCTPPPRMRCCLGHSKNFRDDDDDEAVQTRTRSTHQESASASASYLAVLKNASKNVPRSEGKLPTICDRNCRCVPACRSRISKKIVELLNQCHSCI